MRTADFDYHLPPSAIAQPPPRRDASRLLVLDRESGRMAHRTVRDLPQLLHRGDLLVVNDTKVFRARLHGTISAQGGSASGGDGKPVELLLVRPTNNFSPSRQEREREGEGSEWLALGKPGKRFRVGATITIGKLRGTVCACEDDGSIRIAFDRSSDAVIAYANRTGDIPTPPYIVQHVDRLTDYQTSYARHVGSVAAPTAGFHLTPQLRRTLQRRGIRIACVTLHVGLGTFQPIRTERIEDHVMHAEWAEIPAATARAINDTRRTGGHIIAVGTTTLRTLEGFAIFFSPSSRGGARARRSLGEGGRGGVSPPPRSEGELEGVAQSFSGFINLFIAPSFHFRIVDALLTNFHLPKSTLLVLVSAFAAPGQRNLRGRDLILRAYRSALRRSYRFYSFGDAMLISSPCHLERSEA